MINQWIWQNSMKNETGGVVLVVPIEHGDMNQQI